MSRISSGWFRIWNDCSGHAIRLNIDLGVTLQELQVAVVNLVRANHLDAGYIRLSVSRGVGLGLDPSHLRGDATIVISTEQLRLYPQELYERGLDVITASTRVPPAVCIDPQVKSLGRYINNINAKMEANRVGRGGSPDAEHAGQRGRGDRR